MRRPRFSFILLALFLALPSSSVPPDQSFSPPSRKFTFTYQVHVPPQQDGGKLLLWLPLPLPQQDAFQKIEDLHIDSSVAIERGQDSEYGNPYALFRPTAEQASAGFERGKNGRRYSWLPLLGRILSAGYRLGARRCLGSLEKSGEEGLLFGAHDANRVFLSYGRDIRLSPEQQGSPLNYFVYPYAELDGKPLSGLQTHFSFKDIPTVGGAAAK